MLVLLLFGKKLLFTQLRLSKMGKYRMGLVTRIFKRQHMSLRAKTLLFVSFTLVGLLVVLFLVSNNMFLRSVAELERRDTQEDVQRALNALSDKVEQLATIVGDWAPWNDTYEFVEDVNEAYIESNLIDTTFANLGINLMVFVDSSGQIVFDKAFDLESGREVAVPESVKEHISDDSILVRYGDTDSTVSGLVLLPEKPMLIASHPILTSEHEGPIRGALIMGRFLDSAEIESLAENTRLSITVQRLHGPEMSPDYEAALSELSDWEQVVVKPIDEDKIAGYAILKDIYGNPALILRTEMPREIYQQGQTSLLYFLMAFVGCGLVFGLVALLLLEKLVLSPLSRLSSEVVSIGRKGDPSARVKITGSDELSRLGSEINGMLDALQKSQESQRESEEQYAALVGSLTDAVFKIKGKEIDWCNDRVSEIYGYTKEELVGKKASFLFPVDVNAWEFLMRVSAAIKERGFFRDTARVKRKDGSLVDVEYTISQIGGKEPIELVAVARDITERKLVERALQNARSELEMRVRQRTAELMKANKKLAQEIEARRQAEDTLRQNEEYLRVLMENAFDVVLVLNPDATVRYKSASFDLIVGESRAGQLPLEFIHPDDMPYALETLGQVISKPGETIQSEIRGKHRDGSWRTFEVKARNFLDHPIIKGILVNFRDITERKRLELERARAEALQESESKLRRLIEEMDDGYCVIQEYKVVFVNSRGAEMFGYKPDEVIGKTIWELLPSAMAEELAGIYKDAGDGGALPSKHQITLMRKDGALMQVELGARFTEYAGKSAISFVIRDITERKRMEEELRRRERDYLILLESIHEGIIVFDAETLKVVFGNPRAAKMFGFDPVLQDGVGVSVLDFVHPEDRDVVLKGLAEDLLTSDRRKRYEVRAKTKDGREIWVSALATRVEFHGRLAVLLSARDITESKKMEKALRQSEEKFRNVLDNSIDMIYRLNLETGRYDYVSPSSDKVLGLKPEEFMVEGVEGLIPLLHPDDIEPLRENINKFLLSSGKECSSVEYRVKHAQSGYRWVNDNRSIVYGEGGMPIAVVGILRDVTERKNAEEKLKQLMAELTRSNKELEEFAYVASHDLQEPLRMVASYTQLLARRYKGKLDADADEFISYAVGGATRMQQLINALLEYSRVSTRGKPFELTDCEDVLYRAVTNLKVSIEENEAVVTHDPLPVVRADATQMVQLFQNLISNSIKFHGDKRPEVHIGARRNGTEWQFWVRDNGIGIDPKYFDRIFVIFQRLHGREEYPGTGIGLTICKKIVERHKGRIWVESQPGQGATFYFTIPDGGGES